MGKKNRILIILEPHNYLKKKEEEEEKLQHEFKFDLNLGCKKVSSSFILSSINNIK